MLLDKVGKDSFGHEQNLLIKDSKTALILGCGHTGIVNILQSVNEKDIDICVGGYHLIDPVTKHTVSNNLLDEIAEYLSELDHTQFYTCHCTGMKAYRYLRDKLTIYTVARRLQLKKQLSSYCCIAYDIVRVFK